MKSSEKTITTIFIITAIAAFIGNIFNAESSRADLPNVLLTGAFIAAFILFARYVPKGKPIALGICGVMLISAILCAIAGIGRIDIGYAAFPVGFFCTLMEGIMIFRSVSTYIPYILFILLPIIIAAVSILSDKKENAPAASN